jgi:hypothetical protein
MQLSSYLFFTTTCEPALAKPPVRKAGCRRPHLHPLGMQPWGSYYGKLSNRFGVQWMLNCVG